VKERTQLTELIDGGIGVELGVAKGLFSFHLLQHSNLELLFSIDAWGSKGRHNTAEALRARERLSKFDFRSVILRMTFHDASQLFADETFDFIYIDGCAQFGPARTIKDWYPKCKLGGIFGGHDYFERWPRTIKAVDEFIAQKGYELNLTTGDRYPSWWVRRK
jgi:hypothetical protein